MVKLFKEISASNYGKWMLYGIIGLVSVSIFPSFSLGWLCLNIIVFYFINTISIVLHELAHAITALCLGMEVTEIVIGNGVNALEFQLFGIPWKIKQSPFGGSVHTLRKSTFFYRSRSFIFGPLTHLTLVYLILTFPLEFIIVSPPGIYIYPGIILFIANAIDAIENLFPQYINIDERQVPNDGLRMLNLLSMSKREVAEEVSNSWLVDGYNLESSGNYQKAIESFSKAIYHIPDCFQAYQRRGNAYRSIEDEQRAIDNYQQAIDLLSHTIKLEHINASNYSLRAMVYQDWTKIDPIKSQNAIEDLTKAIDLNPTNKSFCFSRAVIYCYLGLESQAIDDFTTVIQLESNGDAYYNRGVTHYQFKNYQSAIDDLDIAIDLDSNSASAYYSRGNAKYKLKDKLGAVQDYDRAKFLGSIGTIMSEDAHGFYARGIAHIRLKNEANAIEDFQIAETLCLEHGNTSLLKQIRQEIEKIIT
jgi:tetratricopeptide (TPR) repeat protein